MLKEIRLASFFRNMERYTAPGNDETNPGFVFLFILLSFILVNLSSFRIDLMALIILLSTIYSAVIRNLKRVFRSIIVAIPLLLFFSISSFILTSEYINLLRSLIFIITILSMGSLMLNLRQRNLLVSLSSLRLAKLSMALVIALRLLNVYTRDMANIIEIHAVNETRRLVFYRKVVKAAVSVFVLRATSIAENLYLRGCYEHYGCIFSQPNPLKKVGIHEMYFLFSSLAVLIYFLFSTSST